MDKLNRSNNVYLSRWILFVALFVGLYPGVLSAYIGPGAGFALVSSLFTLLVSFFLAFFSLLTLPVRATIRYIKGMKSHRKAKVKRVIVLGLDGLDYDLCQRFMGEGHLPNLLRLKERGGFRKLHTTYPSISPVAWSSYATGVNPGKHNIYDFLVRNPKTYLPELSSSRVEPSEKKIQIGPWTLPLGKAAIQFLRKSRSFWSVLGDHGIFSHVLRVPITFPPEKVYGGMLSAMCTPDLLGTQGTFSFYTTELKEEHKSIGGMHFTLNRQGDEYHSELTGPDNPIKGNGAVKLPFTLRVNRQQRTADLNISGSQWTLEERTFSPYIPVKFNFGLGVSARGMCQFYLKTCQDAVELYVSPVQIDPEKPALPISYPPFFAIYLAKRLGRYNTLGLSEDTWALNEGVLDDDAFLDQAYQIHEERESQFFQLLQKTRRGFLTCVFDGTDRIQHMFFRYLVKNHPAKCYDDDRFKHAVRDIYRRGDALVGRILDEIGDETQLFVMSDHGFKSFARGININSWLYQKGYLALKNGDFEADYFRNVDWSKTRAYAVGLAGIYLNVKGRERHGIVESGDEAKALRHELVKEMSGLMDEEKGEVAIRRLIDKHDVLFGPYLNDGPDLIVGYNEGYRISWDGAIGKTTQTVFEDNTKAWSGDHGIDPDLVPGVLFSNRPIQSENTAIIDLAPTVLNLFGVPVPRYVDGTAIDLDFNGKLNDKE